MRVKVFAGFFSLVIVVVAVVAGALVFPRTVVKTLVVHDVDRRPRVSNQSSPSQVLANFDRRPRSHPASPLPGYDCSLWASPWKQVAAGDPVMLVEVCVRELQQ